MSGLNKGEIGQALRINFGVDISLATTALILSEPEVGTLKTFTATIPAVPVTVDGVTLNANEYVEYKTISEDDQNYAGRWRMKAKLTFSSTDVRQSDYVKYRVLS
jgi:hypothetical protein